jgi:hypothetical protein
MYYILIFRIEKSKTTELVGETGGLNKADKRVRRHELKGEHTLI